MEMRLLSAALENEIEAAQSETLELIKTLCRIPAPSHREECRAAFIREWLEVRGFSAEIDDAKNVRCGWGVEESGEIAVVMAHIDTVFPDLEPMPMREENGRLYCPGVGDDTANVAGMLILMDRMRRLGLRPNGGVLFVCNSCEEGLGNLKGCKAIMRDFAPRVKAFLSLDDQSTHVCARAVGSARYRITADTRGGHSFADFGARSAIEVLSRLTCALYRQALPRAAGSVTTYNVGMISGGTSINAIAQHAEMLYEYRSNDAKSLAAMKEKLNVILRENALPDAKVTVELLGDAKGAGNGVLRRAEALCRREKAHQRRFDGLQYPAVAGDSVGELRHVSRRRRAHARRMDRAILALRRNEGGGQRADELV